MSSVHRRAALFAAALGLIAFAGLVWWRVPFDPAGGPVTPVPAGQVFTAEEIARAETYSHWARVWGWSSLAVSVAVACWLGFSRAGERLVARLPGPRWVVVVLAVAGCEVVGRLATLPFTVAAQQHRLIAGLSTQSWPAWVRDLAIGQTVMIVTTSLGLLVLLTVARRLPRRWPLAAGGLLAGFVLLASFVYPLLVEPLFNRFSSLPEGQLRSQILDLADREDVAVDDVLVADASRRTTTLNAYVSGFGATRRVVVYDTLVDGAEQDEVLAVVAHELAHARHDDVLTGALLGAAGAVVGVGLLGLLLRGDAGEPRRVPRVLALVALATLLSAPVQSGVSRQLETRADVEALDATEDPEAFERLHRQLALRALADPTPPAWSQWVFGSHPTVLERVGLVFQQLPDAAAAESSSEQVSSNIAMTASPMTKTAKTMMAAIPAIRSPYSTAEAPRSERSAHCLVHCI